MEAKATRIVAIIPIGVPGMGKSAFTRDPFIMSLKSKSKPIMARIISSDVIRAELIKEASLKAPKASKETWFDSTAASALARFNKELGKALAEAQTFKDGLIIFLDRNHTVATFYRTVKELRELAPKGLPYSVVALVPETGKTMTNYPFSMGFLLTCLMRVVKRKKHPVLMDSEVDRTRVFCTFLSKFRGEQLEGLRGVSVLKMPWTSVEPHLDEQLMKVSGKWAGVMSPFEASDAKPAPRHDIIITDLLKTLEEFKGLVAFPSQSLQESVFSKLVDNLFGLVDPEANKPLAPSPAPAILEAVLKLSRAGDGGGGEEKEAQEEQKKP